MSHSQPTNDEPPPYDQVCSLPNERPSFPEVRRITSSTKSITKTNAQPKFDRVQFRSRLSKIYSQACQISKYGIAPPKDLVGYYASNQMNYTAPRTSDPCSHTTGISKLCRGCLEGERCNQLGSSRNPRNRQISQYTLLYSHSQEQYNQRQTQLQGDDDETVF